MLYRDDTVRLLHEIPDKALPKGTEGTVQQVVRNGEGQISGVDVRFCTQSGRQTVTVPLDALELLISSATQQRTAVIWGIGLTPQRLMETAMHSILDCGFLMREGLNVARLHYDEKERWWTWGERISDPAGAQAAVAGASWDGAVLAFSGRQRFQLELRFKARGGPCLLLHERDAAYTNQARETPAAMALARVLTDLFMAVAAQFCSFPVADPWLMDEDWGSLLRPPFYPDFFLLPEGAFPKQYPESFRTARLTGNHVMLTTLPIKFAPGDDPIERTEREFKMDSLRKCEALGEKYYDQLYETRFGTSGLYSSIKDALIDAISLAEELELKEESKKLENRLQHVKNVFRSQFS